MTARPRAERLRTEALLVRRVPYAEADLVVTLFTEQRGLLSAVARSARRSAKRFPALEPMHLLEITVDHRAGAELGTLVEASLARPRMGLAGQLGALEAAGRALRWARRAAPPHTPEPALWQVLGGLLDALDAAGRDPSGAAATERPAHEGLLAAAGLRMLAAIGWGLELERCVRCGRACEPAAAACLDPGQGGLVCRACGGARIVLRAERRARLAAAQAGQVVALPDEDAPQALAIVEDALAAHAGIERQT